MSRIRTSLQNAPKAPATEDELFVMRKRAWVKQGIASFRHCDINDPWVRQAIANEAERLYGATEVSWWDRWEDDGVATI